MSVTKNVRIDLVTGRGRTPAYLCKEEAIEADQGNKSGFVGQEKYMVVQILNRIYPDIFPLKTRVKPMAPNNP